MKQQYLVTITVDVDSSDEDEKSILKKVSESVEKTTGYVTWQVECQKINNEDSIFGH
jgi:hypothetical protein